MKTRQELKQQYDGKRISFSLGFRPRVGVAAELVSSPTPTTSVVANDYSAAAIDWLKEQYQNAERLNQVELANIYRKQIIARGVNVGFQSTGIPTTESAKQTQTISGYEVTTDWLKQQFANAERLHQTFAMNAYRKMLADRGVTA